MTRVPAVAANTLRWFRRKLPRRKQPYHAGMGNRIFPFFSGLNCFLFHSKKNFKFFLQTFFFKFYYKQILKNYIKKFLNFFLSFDKNEKSGFPSLHGTSSETTKASLVSTA